MKRPFFYVVLAAIALGCAAEQRASLTSGTENALSRAGSSLNNAWVAANEKARDLGADSSPDQLEAAKQKLSAVVSDAKDSGDRQVETAKAELNKINAAERVQQFQRLIQEKADGAVKAKDQVEKDAEGVQKSIHEANQELDELRTKLAQAKSSYDEAAAKAKQTWKNFAP